MKISLNLLPPQQKALLKKSILFRTLEEQLIYIVLIVIVLLVSLFTINKIIVSEINTAGKLIAQQESADEYRGVQDALDVFKTTNAEIRSLRLMQTGHVAWTPLLQAVTLAVPSSIRVNSIETSNVTLTLSGIAKTRDDIVALKQIMQELKIERQDEKLLSCFSDVVVPDEDLVTAENTIFSLKMTIAEDCLKQY